MPKKAPKTVKNPTIPLKKVLQFLSSMRACIALYRLNTRPDSPARKKVDEHKKFLEWLIKEAKGTSILPLGGSWKLEIIKQLLPGDRAVYDTRKVKKGMGLMIFVRDYE